VALMLAAWCFYAAPLFVPGAGLVVLAGLASIWIKLAARDVTIERRLDRRRVLEGGRIVASLEISGGRFGLPGLQGEDPLQDGVELRRGIHHFAPPAVTLSDPFGLAVAHCHGRGGGEDVMVLPATDALNWRGSELRKVAGGPLGAGHQEPWAAGDIDGLRGYRPGTPAARIHWPAVAKGTGLLERRLVADHEQLPLVVLDNRCDLGADGEAALDAAVRATASITLAMARSGGCNVLLPGTRHPTPLTGDLAGWPLVHARLATVKSAEPNSAPPLPRNGKGGLIRVAAQHPDSPPTRRGREFLIVPSDTKPRRALVSGERPGRAPVPPSRGRGYEPGFALLAAYGLLRWATLVRDVDPLRWVALGVVATVLAAMSRLPRRAAAALAVIAAAAAIPVSGFPLGWLTHLRFAVGWRTISAAINELPAIVVPYASTDNAIRATIVLLAGLLLVLAGALFAVARRSRALLAAVPLLLVAAVPSALARPHLALPLGALLLVLLAPFIAHAPRHLFSRPATAVLLSVAALTGIAVTPVLDSGAPWLSFARLASRVDGNPNGAETFNWSQNYGPVSYPQNGVTVLTISARFPYFWKTEDLDAFDAFGWTSVAAAEPNGLQGVSPAALRRYTEELTVSVASMTTTDVIAAGIAQRPTLADVAQDADPGSWQVATPLQPGDRYEVKVYAPHPSATALERAGTSYPAPIRQFAISPVSLASPYRSAVVLAHRLQVGTRTPYGYAEAVMRYLQQHESYSLDPPLAGDYPLLQFLFSTHRGYCQQFAGAMALLMRIGHVPARVAVGFTSGSYDPISHDYVVTDIDAHAWVEIWFPGYGWVEFNPTPALGASTSRSARLPGNGGRRLSAGRKSKVRVHHRSVAVRRRGVSAGDRQGSFPWVVFLLAPLLAIGAGLVRVRRRRTDLGVSELLDEFELAFARLGDPLRPGATLTDVQAKVRGSRELITYIGALRDARFAGAEVPPRSVTVRGRRALRRWLTRGEGVRAWILAILAVPPWRSLN
jgi:transglutaminase-like putative cysteine protease